MKGYKFVEDKYSEIGQLSSIASMLHWDANVIMPKGSSEVRGHQLAYLMTKIHHITTSDELSQHIGIASQNVGDLDNWQKANLKLIERDVKIAKVLPEHLVADLTLAANKCEMVWREARKQNDFAKVLSHLAVLLEHTKEAAVLKGEALQVSPYDALLSEYDFGQTTVRLDSLFKGLKSYLIDFVKEVVSSQKVMPFKKRHFALDKQVELNKKYLSKLHFDFEVGRLDVSTHPFCGGIPEDSRVTTRFDESDITMGIYGTIHEAGHSFYERNLPLDFNLQPVGSACGFAIHESQSLFFEKQLGLNKHFIANLHKDIVKMSNCEDYSLQEFSHMILKVEPSLIRVNADEVTYPLHVILRYEIEKDLLSGALDVKNLPERWNHDMQEMLGIVPAKDSDGCLQDIHWYGGSFGYFPSYTVGALTAAQIMAKIRTQIPNLDDLIKTEDYGDLFKWLNQNIHAHGSKFTPSELIKNATGQELNIAHFKKHLQDRYLA